MSETAVIRTFECADPVQMIRFLTFALERGNEILAGPMVHSGHLLVFIIRRDPEEKLKAQMSDQFVKEFSDYVQ